MSSCVSCDSALPSGARFCPSCGTPSTPVDSVEERKVVTVVFCDLVGSTTLSAQLDPETLRSVTLRYFAVMRDRIDEFGGTVEKFIGDAVMAVFGIPVMHEDDARRAAAATLGMLEALAELNVELEHSLGIRLRVRIGVNTGPVVTSTDVSSRQALVSGETVNIAARLEQNAGEGEILIGPMTRRAAGSAIRVEPVGPVRLKGKADPVDAYRLLGLGEELGELMRRFDVPFIGRAAQLDALDRALTGVTARGGAQLLTVLGEPGIGKSRLVRAWLDRLTAPVALGVGRCRPYGERGSLAPLADAVHRLLAGPAGESARAAGTLDVLQVGLLQDGTPGSSLEGTCSGLVRLLGAMAAERPVVVVVDDCQWGNDPLFGVVDRLVRELNQAPVLFVCLSRLDLLDRRPDWGRDRRSLTLSGLSVPESHELAAALTEVGAHWSAVPDEAVASAAGNPFHLEQLLAAASEADGGRDLPPTLQAVLGARVDALDRSARTALDLAAVLGRDFAPRHVAALAGSGPEAGPGGPLRPNGSAGVADGPLPTVDATVQTAIARLSRGRLVEATPAPAPGAAPFRFSSSLVHEVTYQAMGKRIRAERHERLAGLLTGDATVADHAESAYRYRSELGLLDQRTDALRIRAAELLASAGSHALARSDLARAQSLLERAVNLLGAHEAGWAAATRRLAEVRIATGHGDQGRALLRTVLDTPSDPVEAAHAELALAVADPTAAAGQAAAVARQTLPVFEAAGDELGQARVRIRMAQEFQLDGRHGQAYDLLAAGLAHAVRCDAEPERALALGAIGVSLWRGPSPTPAAVLRCRELRAEHSGPRPTVRVTLNCPLAVLLALREEWDEARTLLAEARDLTGRLGFAEGEVVLPVFEAAVESLADRPGPALALLDEAASAARRLAAGGLLGTIAREAGRVLMDQGRRAEAADRLAVVDGGPDLLRADAADLDGLSGRLAAGEGDFERAVGLTERAVAAAARTDSPVVQAVAALDHAMVLESAGRRTEAAAAAAAARCRFEAKGHLPGERRAGQIHTRLVTG